MTATGGSRGQTNRPLVCASFYLLGMVLRERVSRFLVDILILLPTVLVVGQGKTFNAGKFGSCLRMELGTGCGRECMWEKEGRGASKRMRPPIRDLPFLA